MKWIINQPDGGQAESAPQALPFEKGAPFRVFSSYKEDVKQGFLNKIGIVCVFFMSCWGLAYSPDRSFSPSQVPEELKGLETQEKLGAFLDLNLPFRDEKGQDVTLKNYVQGQRPVLFSIIYYNCPNLCGLHLNGLSEGLTKLPKDFKKKFHFVLLSMDDSEGPELANQKKQKYIEKYKLLPENTHFLTGDKKNIQALSKQVGFRFRWDAGQQIFAHLPVAYVLTPEGQISRYLYGVLFKPRTLRLSLVEGSLGKIGSIVDRALLFCFQFDPKRRKYSWYAYNIMRAGGVVSLLLLLCFLLPVWIHESKKKGCK